MSRVNSASRLTFDFLRVKKAVRTTLFIKTVYFSRRKVRSRVPYFGPVPVKCPGKEFLLLWTVDICLQFLLANMQMQSDLTNKVWQIMQI